MTNTLKLRIITPETTFQADGVDMVTLPGVEGEMGIFPQHIRLMTQMVPGELVLHKDGRNQFLAVGEGLVEVSSHAMDILTDMAVAATRCSAAARTDFFRRGGFRQCGISSFIGTAASQAPAFGMTPAWGQAPG